MSFDLWLAFAIASAILLAIPGPTVMVVVSYALGRGRVAGLSTVPGVMLGDLTAMTVSLAGAGAILATSATMFAVLKYAGAAYLVWLGIKLWRAKVSPETFGTPLAHGTARRMFTNAYLVTALNPKSIAFFIAFVPQFMDPGRDVVGQSAILIATFVLLGGIEASVWSLMAGTLRTRFQKPRSLRLMNRIGGSFMIGGGVLMALTRRTV
jgi:threonine/homoserine/homoserine lactone efflux protein